MKEYLQEAVNRYAVQQDSQAQDKAQQALERDQQTQQGVADILSRFDPQGTLEGIKEAYWKVGEVAEVVHSLTREPESSAMQLPVGHRLTYAYPGIRILSGWGDRGEGSYRYEIPDVISTSLHISIERSGVKSDGPPKARKGVQGPLTISINDYIGEFPVSASVNPKQPNAVAGYLYKLAEIIYQRTKNGTLPLDLEKKAKQELTDKFISPMLDDMQKNKTGVDRVTTTLDIPPIDHEAFEELIRNVSFTSVQAAREICKDLIISVESQLWQDPATEYPNYYHFVGKPLRINPDIPTERLSAYFHVKTRGRRKPPRPPEPRVSKWTDANYNAIMEHYYSNENRVWLDEIRSIERSERALPKLRDLMKLFDPEYQDSFNLGLLCIPETTFEILGTLSKSTDLQPVTLCPVVLNKEIPKEPWYKKIF